MRRTVPPASNIASVLAIAAFALVLLSVGDHPPGAGATHDPAPPGTDNPRWKILVLVYTQTDFTYEDESGQHHVVATMTQDERDRASGVAAQFITTDVAALNGGHMVPEHEIRFPARALTSLTSTLSCGYAPDIVDTAPELDPAFDSVIVIWDDTGMDESTGQPADLYGPTCLADVLPRGTNQTYFRIVVDSFSYRDEHVVNDTFILKHEWIEGAIYFYDAAEIAPRPRVTLDVDLNDNPYVHCPDGTEYDPSTTGNNDGGFYHDVSSGTTALRQQPDRCLGITENAWASGGPIEYTTGSLVVNGNFEADGNNDGRPGSWTPDGHVTRSAEVVHGGSYAMKHFSSDNAHYVVSQIITGRRVDPGRNYQFTGWTNLPPTSDSFTFKIEIRWRDTAGSTISTSPIKTYRNATSGWDQASATILAPVGTVSGEVRMVASSLKATVYVDDFRLLQGGFQPGDADADGFIDGHEMYMGTDLNRACPATTVENDEPVDSWPPDFNDDTVVSFSDIGRLNQHMGDAQGDPNYDPRLDLNGNGVIWFEDLQELNNRFGQTCR